jgi:hypothetical protein
MRFGIGTPAAAALLALAGVASAQDVPPQRGPEPPVFQIPAGARVRLSSTVLPGGMIEGRVTTSTDDALGLVLPGPNDSPFGGTPVVVPRSSVTDARVYIGTKRYTAVGGLAGGLAGAALGAAAQVDDSDCGTNSDAFCSRGEAIVIGAVTGALIGGVVGHFVKTERWQRVSIEALAPRSSAGPSRPRVRRAAAGLAVTVRF